jgi:hypothetical protein
MLLHFLHGERESVGSSDQSGGYNSTFLYFIFVILKWKISIATIASRVVTKIFSIPNGIPKKIFQLQMKLQRSFFSIATEATTKIV